LEVGVADAGTVLVVMTVDGELDGLLELLGEELVGSTG
jgi:hypothetical protein